MKKYILFLIIFFVMPLDNFAQEFINNYGYNPFDPLQNFQKKKKVENEIIFYFYEYKSADLDLRHFKVFHPQLKDKIPDKLKIIPPSIFDSFSDRVYAVTYIRKCENCRIGTLVIMLVGEYYSNKPAYYIDINIDGNYNNDGIPFVFTTNKKSTKVELKNEQGNKYLFWLYNTHHQKKVKNKELTEKAQQEYKKIAEEEAKKKNTPESDNYRNQKDGLDISLALFTGTGNLTYEYIDLATDYLTTYEVNSNSGGVSLNLGYTWKNIQLSFVGASEGLYYWSSRKRIQYGEPQYLGEDYISGFKVEINSDLHPKKRLFYGFQLAYNIRLGRWIAVAPYVNHSWFSYSSEDNFYRSIRRDATSASVLENRTWNAYGLSLKGYLGAHSELYFFGENIQLNFNPASYFESLEIRDLEIHHNQFNFGVGYRYHF